MSPSIEQLDRFVRSARAGSYSAAAQELYVSPQTVSKSVHDMERKLNIVLFEPTGRRLRPTARGAQVLHRASKVLEGVDDIRRICGDGGLSGAAGTSRLRVAVASSPLRGSVMAEHGFRGFRRRCPHIALDVSFLSSGSCLSELESGAVDAAVVAGRPGAEGLVSERVGTVELRLLVSRGHALASRKSLVLADLEGTLLAEPYDSSFLKAMVLELLSRHGVRPRMASLEMSAARHHGFLHEDGGAVLVVYDGRYPDQFPDVEAVPFAEGEGMELPAFLAWRQEAAAARMGVLAECLRGSR
ncbi:LysR family transcriptional regulator [uncultured Senegalimassilia sp.]|uniref:LysR substrate-binding domain-containing protein n=1 Tax=uncultured Senegalimassilia sp. TaxID=1714350 RepID=UPI002609A401|nr:LysR family transcriptional regulator [uncultured Senegalimassilia sp.]